MNQVGGHGRISRWLGRKIENLLAAKIDELVHLQEERAQLAEKKAISRAESLVREERLNREQRAQFATEQAIALAQTLVSKEQIKREQRVQLATNEAIAVAQQLVREEQLNREQRAQQAIDEAIAIAERQDLEGQIRLEKRAQLATDHAISVAIATSISATRRLVEERTRVAANDAKAYADSAMGGLSRSIAASNGIVVRTEKQILAHQKLLDEQSRKIAMLDLSKEIETINNLLTSRLAYEDYARSLHDEFISRLEAIDKNLSSIREDLDSCAKNAEPLRNEFIGRFENVEREVALMREDYNGQLRNAEQRIEFIRVEAMYEMQALLMKGLRNSAQSNEEPRIINHERVDAMRASGLRLNLGCGHIMLADYLNVDGRELPGVDVIADATHLPFEANELLEIHSAHLVEHFSSHMMERVVLPYWFSLLKSGGTLTTVAPDGAAMLTAVNSGDMPFDDFREVLFGGQEYEGDFHYNLITPESWSDNLNAAGFVKIKVEYAGKRNGKCFEFKISAEKP